MAHRFEMTPFPPERIAELPKLARFRGEEMPTADVETRVKPEDRCEVEVTDDDGSLYYPWRNRALREYDESGKRVGFST